MSRIKVVSGRIPLVDFQSRDDMRTLADAEKIRSDPKRLKAAAQCAQRELAALKPVARKASMRKSKG